jgi:hypothetical protein
VNRKLLVFTLLLALTACRDRESSQDVERGAVDISAAQAPYSLRIVFRGLAAFAEEDTGKIWAFLVDADYEQDPRDANRLPPAESLPPGVFDEINSGISDLHNYPSHVSIIRLMNAEVISGPTPDPTHGLRIDGGDLTFENNLDIPSKNKTNFAPLPNFCELSDANKIFAARPELDEQARLRIAALDVLDPELLALTGALNKRLSARARIGAGRLTAGPVYCPGGRKGYSFKLAARAPIGLQCPGQPENAVRLAEEVQVEQENVTVPTVINLGPTIGKSIAVRPINPDKPVIIEILNQTKEAIEGDQCLEERHPQVFRWFYRLTRPQGQADTSSHLFPCEKVATHGDPKCPVKKMIIPGSGG